MKISLPIISCVFLIISLFGVYKAYSLPTERTVIEDVTLLDYQHQGTFDYLAYVKPSYLYGPEPPQTSSPLPEVMKYPIDIIDHINVTFNYSFAPDEPVSSISEEVEIRAVVRDPGVKGDEEIILVPKATKTGEFTVTFPLKFSDNVTDNYINLSDNISGKEIIITAYVYAAIGGTEVGPLFESFTQNLPIRAKGPIIEMEGELNHTSSGHLDNLDYEQRGTFDYEVYIKPLSSSDSVFLKPPSVSTPAPVALTTLNSDNIIMSNLLDGMDVTFSYQINSSKAIKQLDETVVIDAILESPDKWAKTFELVPITNNSGDYTVTFPLDLKEYITLFDTIQKETGSSASARNLTIKAIVHVMADTDYGPINTDFIQSITTDLTADTLAWSSNLTKFEPGSIKTTKAAPQIEKYLRLPVSQSRVLFTVIAGIIFAVFIFSLFWYLRPGQGKLTAIDKQALQAQKKYKKFIIEAKELPVVKPGETVILLNSLDDLIKTAEGLLKPLLHKAEGQKHIYCVFDAETRYEYHLS
jgi:hypothetical protein